MLNVEHLGKAEVYGNLKNRPVCPVHPLASVIQCLAQIQIRYLIHIC